MNFGSNINTLMQQIMAMKSPEILEALPAIEEIPFESRVLIVRRGHDNISSIIKHWDKFSDILAAQRDMTKSEIKAKAKSLKNVRSKLEMALRLADPKQIPAPFRGQAEAAFNVVAAWFAVNQDYLEGLFTRNRITREDIDKIELPARHAAGPGGSSANAMSEAGLVLAH